MNKVKSSICPNITVPAANHIPPWPSKDAINWTTNLIAHWTVLLLAAFYWKPPRLHRSLPSHDLGPRPEGALSLAVKVAPRSIDISLVVKFVILTLVAPDRSLFTEPSPHLPHSSMTSNFHQHLPSCYDLPRPAPDSSIHPDLLQLQNCSEATVKSSPRLTSYC